MDDDRATALHAALDAHERVARLLRLAALPAWLGLDVPIGQLKSLLLVANREAVSVSELATLAGRSRPMASLLVDQLTRRGLVTRVEDPVDRRRCVVRLSEAGRMLVEQLYHGDPVLVGHGCAHLEDAALPALGRGLGALAAVAAGLSPTATMQPGCSPRTARRRRPVARRVGSGAME